MTPDVMLSSKFMEKNTIMIAAGAVIATAALITAIATNSKVGKIEDGVNFDTSINVPVAGMEAETIKAEVAETEYTEAVAESEDGEAAEIVSAEVNIILSEGKLHILDSTLRVPKSNAEGIDEDLCVYLPGDNAVKYNSTSNYLVVNDNIIIKTIDAADVTYNGISEFMGSDGDSILIGERKVNETSALAVVYTVPDDRAAVEEDVNIVKMLLDSARSQEVVSRITLFGVEVNPDWAEDIVMTEDALQLMKGEKSIYITSYTGAYAGGTTNTLSAGKVTLTYPDNAKDTNTSYTPYIYEFSPDQGGMVQASGSSRNTFYAKLLAQGNGDIKDLFNR